jgi:hypothetical protein
MLKDRVAAGAAERDADQKELEELEDIFGEVSDRISDLENPALHTVDGGKAPAAGASSAAAEAPKLNGKAEIIEESTWGFGGGGDAGFSSDASAVPVRSLGVMGKGVKRKQAAESGANAKK